MSWREVGSYLAWRPEWPVGVVAVAAWTWVVAGVVSAQHGAPGAHHGSGMSGTSGMGVSAGTPAMTLGTWTLMCVAMTLPVALPAARHVALNSYVGRRWWALICFSSGFLAPWVAFGVVALAAVELGRRAGLDDLILVAALMVTAALWQVAPAKRAAVLSCSRTVPLPPGGLGLPVAASEFGLRQSLRCLLACWPAMIVMAALPHGPVMVLAMVALTIAMVAETRSRRRRRLIPALALPFALTAVAAGAVALVG